MRSEPLLSKVGRRNWNCRCCNPDKPEHGLIRQREKRTWVEWLDEYEESVPEHRCSRGYSCECGCADYLDSFTP